MLHVVLQPGHVIGALGQAHRPFLAKAGIDIVGDTDLVAFQDDHAVRTGLNGLAIDRHPATIDLDGLAIDRDHGLGAIALHMQRAFAVGAADLHDRPFATDHDMAARHHLHAGLLLVAINSPGGRAQSGNGGACQKNTFHQMSLTFHVGITLAASPLRRQCSHLNNSSHFLA